MSSQEAARLVLQEPTCTRTPPGANPTGDEVQTELEQNAERILQEERDQALAISTVEA